MVAFAILAGFAVWFGKVELTILRVAAIAALGITLIALGAVVISGQRGGFRRVRWVVVLFCADACVAFAPSAYSHPWFGQGRFDNLPRWLPSNGSINDRTKISLKIYGTDLVYHVVVQALGLLLILGVTVAAAIMVIGQRGSRAGRLGNRRWLTATVIALVVGSSASTGLLTTLPARLSREGSWTAGRESSSDAGAVPPPLGLYRARNDRVVLVVARCGQERVLSLESGGHLLTSAPSAAPGTPTTAEIPDPDTQVKIRIATTRYYATTVTFARLPRTGKFEPARTGDTYADMFRPGYAC